MNKEEKQRLKKEEKRRRKEAEEKRCPYCRTYEDFFYDPDEEAVKPSFKVKLLGHEKFTNFCNYEHYERWRVMKILEEME